MQAILQIYLIELKDYFKNWASCHNVYIGCVFWCCMGSALKVSQKKDPSTIKFSRSLNTAELESLLLHLAGIIPHSMGYGVRTENQVFKDKSGCRKQPFIEKVYGDITSPDRTLRIHFEADSVATGYASVRFWYNGGEAVNSWPVRKEDKDESRLVEKLRVETAKYLAGTSP